MTLGTLEIGRFIAASVVVLTHMLPDIGFHSAVPGKTILGGIQFPGAIAVQFFFVLSGFVMMTAHRADFGRAAAVPRFWWRRACRLYPAYWIILLIPIHYEYGFLTPRYLEKLLTLRPVSVVEFIPPAWSLRYEVAFYLVFGLCLLPYLGRPLLALWVFAVSWIWCPPGLLAMIGVGPPFFLLGFASHHASLFLAPFEFYFFAGLLGGWMFSALPIGRVAGLALLAVGLIGLAATLPAMHGGFDFGPPATAAASGLAFAALMVGMASLERSGVPRLGVTARRLGAMSYPLYLLHVPLLLVFSLHSKWLKLGIPGLYGLAAFGLVAIYGLSAAFAFGIDQPLQRLLRRLSRRGHRPSVGQAVARGEGV